MLREHPRKNQISIEQLTTELASERGNLHKMENSKMMLENQNKELKVKLEQVEKIDNGLQKGSKKKVKRGPKIERLREEQATHRNSIDDRNKDLYKLKKKKAKLQGEKNEENRNDYLERMRREEVTKAHLKGPKKNLADLVQLVRLVREEEEEEPDRSRVWAPKGEREVQRKIEASGQPTFGWIQASPLSRPLQASPAPYPGLSRASDTDPHDYFVMGKDANTARGSTMLK